MKAMKKFWIFIGGFISGIIFLFVVAYCIGNSSSKREGVTYFDRPGEVLRARSVEVFQVLDDGRAALATPHPCDPSVVLLVNDGDEYYYDDQNINIPEGQCLRQIGIYKYMTKKEFEKTVPIVQIMDE